MSSDGRVLEEVYKSLHSSHDERVQTPGGRSYTFGGNVMQPCPFRQLRMSVKDTICFGCRENHCARMDAIGLDWFGEPLPIESRPACGAKCRDGSVCEMRVIPGKRRCRAHGGLSTGPKTGSGRDSISNAQKKRWDKPETEREEVLSPEVANLPEVGEGVSEQSERVFKRPKRLRGSRRISPLAL